MQVHALYEMTDGLLAHMVFEEKNYCPLYVDIATLVLQQEDVEELRSQIYHMGDIVSNNISLYSTDQWLDMQDAYAHKIDDIDRIMDENISATLYEDVLCVVCSYHYNENETLNFNKEATTGLLQHLKLVAPPKLKELTEEEKQSSFLPSLPVHPKTSRQRM